MRRGDAVRHPAPQGRALGRRPREAAGPRPPRLTYSTKRCRRRPLRRSLAISQRLLGTREIILIHHTDCGMITFTEDAFKRSIQGETGIKPGWAAEAFADLDEDVRQSIARITSSPFIVHKDAVRGFVFDVATGLLREIEAETEFRVSRLETG